MLPPGHWDAIGYSLNLYRDREYRCLENGGWTDKCGGSRFLKQAGLCGGMGDRGPVGHYRIALVHPNPKNGSSNTAPKLPMPCSGTETIPLACSDLLHFLTVNDQNFGADGPVLKLSL
jgi:hypothetical protein